MRVSTESAKYQSPVIPLFQSSSVLFRIYQGRRASRLPLAIKFRAWGAASGNQIPRLGRCERNQIRAWGAASGNQIPRLGRCERNQIRAWGAASGIKFRAWGAAIYEIRPRLLALQAFSIGGIWNQPLRCRTD